MSVVGFDFGNESCVVAIARQRGIDVVLYDESERETPAIVCFSDKQRFLGGFIWLVMILLLLVFVNVDRRPLVSVLGVPNHMTYADFCQFCGSFIHHLLEMRILSILIRLGDQYSAHSFYNHFNGKHFSSLEVDRRPLVSVLGVPNHMTYADFCQFCGSFIHHLLEMRILSILIRLDDQYSADSFYKHFNGKHFSSFESNPEAYCLHNIGGIISLVMILLLLMFGQFQATLVCQMLEGLVLLICVTKVVKSSFDKALAEHADIDYVVGSEEPIERDHGVDLQQLLLIKIDSSDSHKKWNLLLRMRINTATQQLQLM
ncbi:hypothetical protein OROHE_016367 [Orobanche hederae]